MRCWTCPLISRGLLVAAVLALTASCGGGGSDGVLDDGRGDTSIQIVIAGTGGGLVSHNLGQGGCTQGTCTWDFTPGLVVTLTATPDATSVFTGWSGDCAGTAPCTLTVTKQFNVVATFDK